MLTPFTVGQKVRIDLQAMRDSNRSCVTPNYPSDRYIQEVTTLVEALGPIGTVTHTFPPGYELTVAIGGRTFSMKGHRWALPIPVAVEEPTSPASKEV